MAALHKVGGGPVINFDHPNKWSVTVTVTVMLFEIMRKDCFLAVKGSFVGKSLCPLQQKRRNALEYTETGSDKMATPVKGTLLPLKLFKTMTSL
jgi:hypothetical protein